MFCRIVAAILFIAPAIAQTRESGQPDEFRHLVEQYEHAVPWDELRTQLESREVTVGLSEDRRNPGEPAVIALSMQQISKAAEGRGILGLKWDQRHVANVELLEIGTDLYLVLSAEGSTSLKAPWGAWHIEQEGVPSFYTGPGVGGMIRGSLER